MTTDAHDAADRALPGEGHFTLLDRDPLSPWFERLYAEIRQSGPDYKDKARELLERAFAANDGRQKNPQKDQAHAWSARAAADHAEAWFNANIKGRPINRWRAPERLPPEAKPLRIVPVATQRAVQVGDVVELTAPVHVDNEQITTGTVGTVRELVPRKVNPGAMVEFPAFRMTVLVFYERMKHHGGEL